MHSTLNRIQQVFGFFTSVAFAVAGAVALSVFLIPQAPSASLQLKNVQVVTGRPHYYSVKKEQYAHIRFDLDADLSSVFNWNTKQIFLYITASYPTSSKNKDTPNSEVIVWDAVIPSDLAPWHQNTWIHPTGKTTGKGGKKEQKFMRKKMGKPYPDGGKPGIVKLSDQKPKYQVTDITGKIARRSNATLTLHWNVQPWVGALLWDNRQTVGRWEVLKGGLDKFDFPELRSATEIKKEDLKTATGAEKNRGSPA